MNARWIRFVGTWPGAVLVFLSAAFLAYWPALNGPLMWDDHYLVGANPFFRSPVFVGEVFRHWLYLDSTSHYYRPVQNLSYMLDYWLWGGAAFGYHFTNIVLHGLCGAALFALLRKLLKEFDTTSVNVDAGAFGVALLWTVHPAHNAAIAYIAGRADSLAMLGAVCAWLLADRAGRGWRIGLGVLAALCGLLALCAKELAIFWFVLFALHRLKTRRWIQVVAAVLVVGMYLGLRSLPEARAAIANAAPPFDERGLLMLRAIGDYAGLLVWPAKLMMDRSTVSPVAHESYAWWLENLHFEYLSLIGLAAVLFVVWMCRRRTEGQRWRIAGIVWFTLGFLPISNLFPLNAPVAEHWIYHASIGAFIFAAGCFRPRTWAFVVMIAGAAFTARTAFRAADWADPERFFLKNIHSGGGTPRIHMLLSQVYFQRGDYARQETLLRDLLVRFPNHPGARNGLAACLAKQGRQEEAQALLASETPADTPRRPTSAWDGVRAEVARQLAARDIAGGRTTLEAFAAAHWWHLDAHLALGELRSKTGDFAGAVAAYHAAMRLDIHDLRAAQRLTALRIAHGAGLPPISSPP